MGLPGVDAWVLSLDSVGKVKLHSTSSGASGGSLAATVKSAAVAPKGTAAVSAFPFVSLMQGAGTAKEVAVVVET